MNTRQRAMAILVLLSLLVYERTETSAEDSFGKSPKSGGASTDRSSEDLLAGFPATILNYELVSQKSSDFPDADNEVRLRATINQEEYTQLVKGLEEMLRPNAKETGVGLLGLADPRERRTRGILYFGPTSPAALTEAVNSAVNDQKGCVVMVGRELNGQPWKETRTGPAARAPGGNKSIPIAWFWVSDQTALPLRNGFRRACEMKLQPVVKSPDGNVPLPIIAPFSPSTDKTVLLPGGPCGHIFSAGTGGGDLNLGYAHSTYLKSLLRTRKWPETAIRDPEDVISAERVLLFMPCMMVDGEFLASTILPVEISLSSRQAQDIERLEIRPIFP